MLSDSNSILEGVTVKLQREWELKKLQFYGNFLGNISFCEDIKFNYATVLLRTIESMSYRQICIIAVFNKTGSPEIDLSSIDSKYKNDYDLHSFDYSMYSDLKELEQLNVFRRVRPLNLSASLGNCVLSDVGKRLYDLMNLEEIDQSDFNIVKSDFENLLGKRLRSNF